MDEQLPLIRTLVIEEIKFLRTRGIMVLISNEGPCCRYWIDGEEVSANEIVARAYKLGMPGHNHLQ